MIRITCRLFAVLAVGLMLAGCDKCGDLLGIIKNPFEQSPKSCRDYVPPK